MATISMGWRGRGRWEVGGGGGGEALVLGEEREQSALILGTSSLRMASMATAGLPVLLGLVA